MLVAAVMQECTDVHISAVLMTVSFSGHRCRKAKHGTRTGWTVNRRRGRVTKARRRVSALLLGMALAAASGIAAADELASVFAKLSYGAECDPKNNRLLLSNTHSFKTLIVKVRWHAAGGKDLEDQFFPGPSSTLEIGCAADAQVVDANFADF